VPVVSSWRRMSHVKFRDDNFGTWSMVLSVRSCLVLVRKHHPWLGTPILRHLRKVVAS
jgi:hypothetical protein